MIRFHRTFLGAGACGVVMVPIYIGFSLYELGGIKGMMNDDSYPISILLLPVMGAIVSGGVFWLVVFPWAQASRWIANRNGLTLSDGCLIAVYVPAMLGVVLGLISSGIYSAVAGGFYVGVASFVFWRKVAKMEIEPVAS